LLLLVVVQQLLLRWRSMLEIREFGFQILRSFILSRISFSFRGWAEQQK
jgi:hypothetical protein